MAVRKKASRRRGKAVSEERSLVPAGFGSAKAIQESDWFDKFRAFVSQDEATAAGGGAWPWIRTEGGIFRFNDDEFENDEVPPFFILGARRENLFYEGDYDPDNPTGPVCFAVGEKEEDLAPPSDLPTKESDACEGCWANAFGSGERPKSKACKNTVRLALLEIPEELDPEVLAEKEGCRLRVSVTGVRNFQSYANKVLKGLGVPLFMLATRIQLEKHPRHPQKVAHFYPAFGQQSVVTDGALLEVLATKRVEAQTYLDQLPATGGESEEEEKPKRERRESKSQQRRKKVQRKARRKSSRRASSGASGKF